MTRNDWSLLLLLSLLWGGSFFFVEVALTGLPVLTIVWCRVALGALILGTVLTATGTALPRGAGVWRALLVMGFLNNVVPFTLFVLAQGRISGSLAAILNATTPLFTVVIAHLATRDEQAGRAKVAGLAAGFAGVVVMMAGEGVPGEAGAMALCLAAALSYALAGVWGRRFRPMGVTPRQAAFGQLLASGTILLPVWLVMDRPWTLPVPGLPVVLAVLGVAALSTALAYAIYFRLLASAGATNLLLVTFLIPVSATALGVAFLGEAPAPRHLAGFLLIIAGLVAIDGRAFRAASRGSSR